MPTSVKFEMPDERPTSAVCRACGEARSFDEYRVFSLTPKKLLMDFCVHCERKHSTIQLYRRFNAYGTPEITEAVFRAERVPEAKRNIDQTRLLVSCAADKPIESTEQLLQVELQRRELARRRLMYYVTTMMPTYMPGWVHQDICRRLERFMKQIEQREAPRLMIFMPPRAGKSQLASDMLPSWILGHHPEWEVIATSYAQSLPLEFSRKIRDRIDSPEYKAMFPNTAIRPDARGIEAWKTTAGGAYVAAGVGTGITGKGFHVGIVDDPIKDHEEAASDLIRDNAFKWYQSTFRTRAAPGAGILFINTRWHHDDPAGRLLEEDEKLKKAGVPDYERENWEVVSYPAIAEGDEYLMRDGSIERDPENLDETLRLLRKKGDALHPERFGIGELKKIRNTFTAGMWSALYQQSPTPDEGDFFKRDDIAYRWLDPAYYPLCRIFMAADYAISKKNRADFTVVGVFALDSEDNIYVLQLRRGRWGASEIVDNVVSLAARYKPEVYAGEQGQIHAAVWPLIEAGLTKERLFMSVDQTLIPGTDKEVRARPMQARTQRRKLFLSYDTSDRPQVYDQLEKEMLQFPNGTHDDTVDCVAWACRAAQNISLPRMQQPPRQSSWRDKLRVSSSPRSFMAG
jgi:phage terminase large subunit-like protein